MVSQQYYSIRHFGRFEIATYAFFIAIFLSSCSLERLAIKSTTSLLQNMFLSLEEEEDMEIAEKAIASQLKMLEGLIKSDPGNQDLLLLAAKGFCSYAFSFIEDHDQEKAKIFYRRGLDYGLQTISSEKSSEELKKGPAIEKTLNKTDNQKVPSLFWTAYCWGGLINLSRNSPESLIALPTVEMMMNRALDLDESYYFGGANTFLGVLYGSLPPMLGGKPEKSKYHFEKALEGNGGNFLMTHVLYARSYAIQTQEKFLFKQLLDKVVNSPPDILPSQRLANEIAKRKARVLLQNIDEYF